MYFFENYSNSLKDVLLKSKASQPIYETLNGFDGEVEVRKFLALENKQQIQPLERPKVAFQYDDSVLRKLFGINPFSFVDTKSGRHPDFMDVGENDCIYHHCISVFIDIVASTKLIGKYNLEDVRLIKDSILTLAIRVASQLGGHVQRLQGDGIFLQFVRRDKNELDSIINALNATSILTSFITTDLAEIMQAQEIDPLEIRVGIDYGREEDVLWSYYGIPGCGELTTTSLHTDMAAKLQGKAIANTILIGNNVYEALDLEKFIKNHWESPYKITKNLDYKFFEFNWQKYLLSHPFICRNTSDSNKLKIELPNENTLYINCYIADEDGLNEEKYFPNSKSIPKNKKIRYELMQGNNPYMLKAGDKIEWIVHNTGWQAKKREQISFELVNQTITANTSAAYLGHHHIECKISNKQNYLGLPKNILFPIFVR